MELFRTKMDLIEALKNADLLQFFRCHKTEMACMENPLTFLTQLRDHDLLPEDRYQKMSRMKSKDKLKKAVYEFLDWMEAKQPQLIRAFWRAVFVELLLNHYPTLSRLYYSFTDGSGSNHSSTSFHTENKVESEARDGRSKTPSGREGNKEANASPAKRKRRKLQGSKCEEDEVKRTKASCGKTPGQSRNSKRLKYYSPLKKGEKTEIWKWPIYRCTLPVRCGKKEGLLHRNQLAKGLKCIVVDKQWFSPTEFERFAGKQACKNWKLTIRCMSTPLGKLIQEGHLKSTRFQGQTVKARMRLSRQLTDDEDKSGSETTYADEQPSTSGDPGSSLCTEGELNEQAEQEPEVPPDICNTVFKVSCGIYFGDLHKKRFASGNCGKCIRTATSWMTPIEFVEASLGQTNTSWRRDILWEEKPLAHLIKNKTLSIHFLNCTCLLCSPNDDDLENEKNDDECWVCKGDEDRLVLCDKCPRSFHKTCHLPYLEDADCGDRDKWLCTFCVYERNKECFYWNELSREEAMSLQLSQHLLKCQYLHLHLSAAEELSEAPSSSSPDESAVFTELRRMLGVIAEKLQLGFYQTVGQFVSNVELIFTNSASPHQAAELIAMGDRLKKVFDEDFKKVFHIVG